MTGDLYRVLALVAVAVLAWYAVRLYHKRRGVELDQRHARHHGWEQVTILPRHQVWKCPRCRALIETWHDVLAHRGVESPCGVLETEQAQLAELEADRAAAKTAEQAGRWSASAMVPAESHSGAVDSFTAEIEGAPDEG